MQTNKFSSQRPDTNDEYFIADESLVRAFTQREIDHLLRLYKEEMLHFEKVLLFHTSVHIIVVFKFSNVIVDHHSEVQIYLTGGKLSEPCLMSTAVITFEYSNSLLLQVGEDVSMRDVALVFREIARSDSCIYSYIDFMECMYTFKLSAMRTAAVLLHCY